MQVQSHTYIGTLMSWKWSTITTYTVHTYHIEPGTALPVRSCISPSHSWCLHRDETCPVSHSSAGSPAWTLARTMCRTVVKEYNTERWQQLTVTIGRKICISQGFLQWPHYPRLIWQSDACLSLYIKSCFWKENKPRRKNWEIGKLACNCTEWQSLLSFLLTKDPLGRHVGNCSGC